MPMRRLAGAAGARTARARRAVIPQTETLLRTNANPLFRAAAPDVTRVRIIDPKQCCHRLVREHRQPDVDLPRQAGESVAAPPAPALGAGNGENRV
jgi:hypothetical protein